MCRRGKKHRRGARPIEGPLGTLPGGPNCATLADSLPRARKSQLSPANRLGFLYGTRFARERRFQRPKAKGPDPRRQCEVGGSR
jgi:hypothetical protein